jgi:hypothetical protein
LRNARNRFIPSKIGHRTEHYLRKPEQEPQLWKNAGRIGSVGMKSSERIKKRGIFRKAMQINMDQDVSIPDRLVDG